MTPVLDFLIFMGIILLILLIISVCLYYTNTLNTKAASQIWSKVRPRQRTKIILCLDLFVLVLAMILYAIGK